MEKIRAAAPAQSMKRSSCRSGDGAAPPVKAAMVRLNVGGELFATTMDTLSNAAYFNPFLSGRLPHGEDESGALFIDRCPKLFAYILQYLRTRCVPSRFELRSIKQSLRHEAVYYGVPGLVSYINGEVSPHDMRPERRWGTAARFSEGGVFPGQAL